MRNPERIPRMLAKLQAQWENYPDMRFFQLLSMLGLMESLEQDGLVVGIKDPFHVEDEAVEKNLDLFEHPHLLGDTAKG